MTSRALWRASPARTRLCLYNAPSCRYLSSSGNRPQDQAINSNQRTTQFGFTTIPFSEKEAKVGAVFSSVASTYNTMNDLMSLGIHRLWKDHFVGSILPLASSSSSSYNILDVAGGTGDIAFRLLNHTRKVNLSLKTKVTVADINADMLSEGQKRATALEYGTEELNFLQANAETLEGVKDSSIDLYTVAFGIRNFADLDKSLRTAFRVLKPGGTFACLEFSHVGNPAFNALYKRWSFGAIPLIGQLVAGDRASYQYLVESIDRFPSQAEFAERIAKTGFLLSRGRGWEDLTGGVAAIHRGIKPLEEDV